MRDVTNGISEVTGDIPDMMAVGGKYLDGIGIVWIRWFRVQDGDEFSEVVSKVATI